MNIVKLSDPIKVWECKVELDGTISPYAKSFAVKQKGKDRYLTLTCLAQDLERINDASHVKVYADGNVFFDGPVTREYYRINHADLSAAMMGTVRYKKVDDKVKTVAKGLPGFVQGTDPKYEAKMRALEEFRKAVEPVKPLVINGINVLARRVPDGTQSATMREFSKKLRDMMGNHGVVVVGGILDDAAQLDVMVSPAVTSKVKAGDLIKALVKHIEGSGGGRPDMAQAGGPKVEGLNEALSATYTEVARILSS